MFYSLSHSPIPMETYFSYHVTSHLNSPSKNVINYNILQAHIPNSLMSGRLMLHNWRKRKRNITHYKAKNWQVKLPFSPPTKLPKSPLMSREHVLSVPPYVLLAATWITGFSWRRMPSVGRRLLFFGADGANNAYFNISTVSFSE